MQPVRRGVSWFLTEKQRRCERERERERERKVKRSEMQKKWKVRREPAPK